VDVFVQGDQLLVKVNKITSIKTQLPYEYYSLEFCKPDTIINSAENLGEVLRGDRIENSVYMFKMKENKKCKVVGRIDKLSEKSAKVFKSRIKDEYHVNMILDNLPVAVPKTIRNENGDTFSMFDRGFLIGGKASVSCAACGLIILNASSHLGPNT
jgi:transmembrane 9 superfamily protein 2/4